MIKEICFANEIIIFARYILMNEEDIMLAYTYIEHGKSELREKARPEIIALGELFFEIGNASLRR